MATAARAVPKTKRTKAERGRTAQQRRCRQSQKLQPLREIFAERDRAVARGEYEILGRIMLLRTEQGDIDFFKAGPFVAKLKTGELVLLNEWQGLPDIVVLLPELCDACRAHCPSCDGTGQRLCTHMNCGGEGKVILTHKACPAEGCQRQTGQAKHDCTECEGCGHVPDQVQDCPECKGTKLQKCPLCLGSGKMATGRKDGAPRPVINEENPAPICLECRGSGRKIKCEPQPWNEYAIGQLEEYTALGPIHGMLWTADEMRDPERHLEYCEIRPDKQGNLAALLVEKPQQTGQPMYLLGGEPVIKVLQ